MSRSWCRCGRLRAGLAAPKVQLAERQGGRDGVLEHMGTGRGETELAVLMAVSATLENEAEAGALFGTARASAPAALQPDPAHARDPRGRECGRLVMAPRRAPALAVTLLALDPLQRRLRCSRSSASRVRHF